jgi:hypothetical protein
MFRIIIYRVYNTIYNSICKLTHDINVNKTDELLVCIVHLNLHNFTENADTVQRLPKDMCPVLVFPVTPRSVRESVLPTVLFSYYSRLRGNRSFLWEVPPERSRGVWGLEIGEARGLSQCSQHGQSPRHAETSNLFHVLATEKWLGLLILTKFRINCDKTTATQFALEALRTTCQSAMNPEEFLALHLDFKDYSVGCFKCQHIYLFTNKSTKPLQYWNLTTVSLVAAQALNFSRLFARWALVRDNSICCHNLLKDFRGDRVSCQHFSAYGLPKLFDVERVACRKHFLCPEILLPVGVLLPCSVFPCQDM